MRENVKALEEKLRGLGILDQVEQRLKSWLPPSEGTPGKKIVKDRVWGLIDLPSWVMPLVDSRLLQRQRRIRQLGMSYLVYPGGGYTRFEHALGCFHAMRQLLAAIDRNGDRSVLLDTYSERGLSLAALLHDVGHMPFSHASEHVLEMRADSCTLGGTHLRDVLDIFGERFGKNVRLAEALSILTVLSSPLQRIVRAQIPDAPDDFFRDVAAFIAGAPATDELRGWGQLVSGECDADKLDYMARDAAVTGVPVSLPASLRISRNMV